LKTADERLSWSGERLIFHRPSDGTAERLATVEELLRLLGRGR
jgi:hypothetical protein